MKIACPHCQSEIEASVAAVVNDTERLTLELKTENEFFSAKTVGSAISNIDKMLRACAKDLDETVDVFIEHITSDAHTLTVKFFIAKKLNSKKENQ